MIILLSLCVLFYVDKKFARFCDILQSVKATFLKIIRDFSESYYCFILKRFLCRISYGKINLLMFKFRLLDQILVEFNLFFSVSYFRFYFRLIFIFSVI